MWDREAAGLVATDRSHTESQLGSLRACSVTLDKSPPLSGPIFLLWKQSGAGSGVTVLPEATSHLTALFRFPQEPTAQ